jgi:hypothetical protein
MALNRNSADLTELVRPMLCGLRESRKSRDDVDPGRSGPSRRAVPHVRTFSPTERAGGVGAIATLYVSQSSG